MARTAEGSACTACAISGQPQFDRFSGACCTSISLPVWTVMPRRVAGAQQRCRQMLREDVDRRRVGVRAAHVEGQRVIRIQSQRRRFDHQVEAGQVLAAGGAGVDAECPGHARGSGSNPSRPRVGSNSCRSPTPGAACDAAVAMPAPPTPASRMRWQATRRLKWSSALTKPWPSNRPPSMDPSARRRAAITAPATVPRWSQRSSRPTMTVLCGMVSHRHRCCEPASPDAPMR